MHMKFTMKAMLIGSMLALASGVVYADKYDEALTAFKQSPKSSTFFARSYGYALFPDIGKAGFIVGGEHGDGQVYEKGKLIGTVSLTQVSVGAQAGAKEYSEIIFFHKQEDLAKFKGGDFELAGNLEATAITLNASASAGTSTSSAEASTTRNNAATGGGYNNGVAVFTIVRGGLLAGVSVGGQKLKFKATEK
jgi:lipid-binding SYLF domain-containing protein